MNHVITDDGGSEHLDAAHNVILPLYSIWTGPKQECERACVFARSIDCASRNGAPLRPRLEMFVV